MKLKALLPLFLLSSSSLLQATDKPPIKIETGRTSLICRVTDNGRLYQEYLGKRLNHDPDVQYLPQGTETYPTHDMEDYFESVIYIRHNDSNSSLPLKCVDHSNNATDSGVNEAVTIPKDDKYLMTVELCYAAYGRENIIRVFTKISHGEKKPVTLCKYASSMLHLDNSKYFLTEFSGNWAHEANVTEKELAFGKKVIDTKLGMCANMFVSSLFQLTLDNPSQENTGEVLVRTIGWTGNSHLIFEVNNKNELCITSGTNPCDSEYSLPAKEVFRTPSLYFTYSTQGRGEASRSFRDWTRNHQVKNGSDTCMILLNNWESAHFDFNGNKLTGSMDEATKLGVDMLLLDNGWFINKYPRSSDHQRLGDWEETADKLPDGVGHLAEEAQKKGIKFGIWIEPEMMNPKSELYKKHKNWMVRPPNYDEYYFRSQVVLNLSNPKIQDHVSGVVDNPMIKYSGIALSKWDCNSPITNIYSVYLKDKQSHLYVDYVRGFYGMLDRTKAKYPDLPMMLCASGGGRSGYETLEYFTESWPSDNTDPIECLLIQWGYSQIFPDRTLCAHVTTWNRGTNTKFRTDVAMMCKLGFDIKLGDMNQNEHLYCDQAVKDHNCPKPVILGGGLYRLVSPYGSNHTSSMLVGKDRRMAAVFTFDIHPRCAEKTLPVRLQGLNVNEKYRVKEINTVPGNGSSSRGNNQVFSGEYLMNIGLDFLTTQRLNSRLIKITEG